MTFPPFIFLLQGIMLELEADLVAQEIDAQGT